MLNLNSVINAIFLPPSVYTTPINKDQSDAMAIQSGEAVMAGSGVSMRLSGGTYGQKFPGGVPSMSAIVRTFDHYAIRQQARDAMYDSIEARALITSMVDTSIDVGLKWKPTPNARILGITQEQAEAWAEDVGNRFHLWAMSKKSHRSRVNNFYQNQQFYELSKQRDNDVFVRFYYGRDKDLLNPLQIEFIDPNQIRGCDYTSTYMQTPGDDGIVRDDAGREIGFKIWNYDKNMKYTETTIPAMGEKSGRVFMIHGYKPEYAGQGRGYSRLTHLIQALSDLTDLKTAVLQKAINQASIIAAVENDQLTPNNPLPERSAAAIPAQYNTSAMTTGGTTASMTEPDAKWELSTEATLRQPGMLIGNLQRGDKLKYLTDTGPLPTFDLFFNGIVDYCAASMGWSREYTLKKFTNNYSASRGTLILIQRASLIERAETISDFLDYVPEMWLAEEIAAGRVTAPGWSDPLLRAAWLASEWWGAPMPNIDPLKTAQADLSYATMASQTLDDIALNYNGSSFKANAVKLKRQWEELPVPKLPITPVNTNPEPDMDDTQNRNGGDNDDE